MTPWLFFIACVFSGTLFFVPEDATVLAAGVAVTGLPSMFGFWLAGTVGLLMRDSGFFFAGRLAGESLLSRPLFKRVVGEDRIAAARERVEQQGARAVVGARFAFGFRSAAFLVAGAMGVRPRVFLLVDGLALMAWLALALTVGSMVREPVLVAVAWTSEHRLLVGAFAGIIAIAWGTNRMTRKADHLNESMAPATPTESHP